MGQRMPGRLSLLKFSLHAVLLYIERKKEGKTDELDIGWGCGGDHSGLRRCGMAIGSDSRGYLAFCRWHCAAPEQSSKPFIGKIFGETIPV